MKANFKYELTDDERREFRNRMTGKKRKALAKRAEVNEFLADCLASFLNGKAAAAKPIDEPADEPIDEPIAQAVLNLSDYNEADIAEVLKQNELLLHRVNVLQHRLDTRGGKK